MIAWPADRDLWVFGYGSLMWHPGFEFREARPGRLYGYHRSFCVRSEIYRGTPKRPGLVLGLDSGGSCRGIAYRVARKQARTVLDYLEDRELRRDTYLAKRHPVRLDNRVVEAICFVVNRANDQYVGKLSVAAMARHVCQGVGERGACFDYLLSTVEHLRELGVKDHTLEEVLRLSTRQRTHRAG